MRAFPPNIKHLNIVLRTLLSIIRNWMKAFRKFWKIRRAAFQIFGNWKIRKISNEWCQIVDFLSSQTVTVEHEAYCTNTLGSILVRVAIRLFDPSKITSLGSGAHPKQAKQANNQFFALFLRNLFCQMWNWF